MKNKPMPSQARLRELFSYEPETGTLAWRKTTRMPKGDRRYTVRQVGGDQYQEHRLVWQWWYGLDPGSYEVDHINGLKTDNRLANLRLVDRRENSRNHPMKKSNTSGVLGVSWMERLGKWRAYINVDYKQKYLGVYKTKEEAIAARRSAELELGFHENHGRN